MLWYTFTVYLLLAKRLSGVVLVDDDNSDQKSVLDLWWNPGCNELSGCKNWMRGVWTEAANQHFSQRGSSLAEASLGGQWVHDDSDTPTTTKHGWIASKLEYKDHVLLLEHDSEDEDPECFPDGLVKMPKSTLNGKAIHPGSVLLLEQCVQTDGGSVEHFGTVTRVHHDGTHVHASTESLTRDDVQLHVKGGSASFLLPLADEMIAEDASTAAKKMVEGNQFLERGTLQRVVKTLTAPTPAGKQTKTKNLMEAIGANLPEVGFFDAVEEHAKELGDLGVTAANATSILGEYRKSLDAASALLSNAADKVGCHVEKMNSPLIVGSCLFFKGSCPVNSYCGWGNCHCNSGWCKKQGSPSCIHIGSSGAVAASFDIFQGKWEKSGEFTRSAAYKYAPEEGGKGIRAGFTGTVTGKYKATARIGATFSASVKWADSAVTEFTASLTGTTSLDISANASITAEAFFHVYLMNYVELNLGDFIGLPMLKLSVMPVISLDVTAKGTAEAKIAATYRGELKIGNDAESLRDDLTPVTITSQSEPTYSFEFGATGSVNAALKVSVVFTAGVSFAIAKAVASVSATIAAEFEGTWPVPAGTCPQFQITSRADGTVDASLLWWAWSRQFALKELAPIEVCGKDHKKKCVWYIPAGAASCPASPGNAMSAISSGEQLDDDYYNF